MNAFKDKQKLISRVDSDMGRLFDVLSEKLYEYIVSGFADRLERNGDNVITSAKNMRLVAEIDKTYEIFIKKHLVRIAKNIITNTKEVSALNAQYFKDLEDAE